MLNLICYNFISVNGSLNCTIVQLIVQLNCTINVGVLVPELKNFHLSLFAMFAGTVSGR